MRLRRADLIKPACRWSRRRHEQPKRRVASLKRIENLRANSFGLVYQQPRSRLMLIVDTLFSVLLVTFLSMSLRLSPRANSHGLMVSETLNKKH